MDERRIPQLSVIVPVYNAEHYIARCARSLFGQTMQDIEYIFIDDCTPDASMDILLKVLEDYPSRKPLVRTFRMPSNSGQAAVRMKGLELAAGEYIGWCDSDDEVPAEAYEKMYSRAIGADADIVTCDFLISDGNGSTVSSGAAAPGRELSQMLLSRCPWSLCNRIIHRRLLERPLIPPVADMGEDMVISFQLIDRARTVAHVPEPLYVYWQNPASTSNAAGLQKAIARWEASRRNSDLLLDYFASSGRFKADSPQIVAFKYRARRYLEPYLKAPQVYSLWRSTYPEVDKVLVFTRGIPLKRKILYLLMYIRIYPYLKRR